MHHTVMITALVFELRQGTSSRAPYGVKVTIDPS